MYSEGARERSFFYVKRQVPKLCRCGTNAAGGKSNIIAVCLGAFMMTLMSTFLNAAKISIGAQRLIQGVFIVLLLCMATRNPNSK